MTNFEEAPEEPDYEVWENAEDADFGEGQPEGAEPREKVAVDLDALERAVETAF